MSWGEHEPSLFEGAEGETCRAAGFSRFRRATETSFNRVFEARL